MLGRRRRKDGDGVERSDSGAPILRHRAQKRAFQPAVAGDERIRGPVDAHLEAHLGPTTMVWHEIVSDLVHLDVYMWAPDAERDHYTFVTVGMSDLPMTVPPDAPPDAPRRAELVVCLPPDWPVPAEEGATWSDESAYFPIRWLKIMGRLPHEYDTWLGIGHTVPNGEPPAPLAPNTRLCGWLVLPPVWVPASFRRLELDDGEAVDFFGLYALHRDEMDHKLRYGAETLYEPFDRYKVTELLDIKRSSVLRRP